MIVGRIRLRRHAVSHGSSHAARSIGESAVVVFGIPKVNDGNRDQKRAKNSHLPLQLLCQFGASSSVKPDYVPMAARLSTCRQPRGAAKSPQVVIVGAPTEAVLLLFEGHNSCIARATSRRHATGLAQRGAGFHCTFHLSMPPAPIRSAPVTYLLALR